jgi:hypothetical protein
MKPYGHKRHDALTCAYGCCGMRKGNVENKSPNARRRLDKNARHRARQNAKAETTVKE